jgi:hypothetical protein
MIGVQVLVFSTEEVAVAAQRMVMLVEPEEAVSVALVV